MRPSILPLIVCLFLNINLSAQSPSETELQEQLDTCSSNAYIQEWAVKISRTYAWEDPDVSHLALKMALNSVSLKEDSTIYSKIIREHAILHAIRQEADSNLFYNDKALEVTPPHDSLAIGYLYRNKGIAYSQIPKYDDALEQQYNALRWLPSDDSLFTPLTYLELSKMLYKVSNYKLSQEYGQKAAEYFIASGNLRELEAAYNTIGLALLNQEPVSQECLVAEHKCRAITILREDTIALHQSDINLGIAHFMLNDMDSAFYYMKMAEQFLPFFEYDQFLEERLTIWTNLATFYYRDGNVTKAKYYGELAYPLAKENNKNFILERTCETLVNVYKDEGKTARALEISMEHTKLVTSNISLKNADVLGSVERELQERTFRKELELAQRESQLEYDQLHSERNLLYGGLGILIILLLLMLQLYRLVLKQRKEASSNARYLNELNDSKNRLFSIIGHDLRGPIGNSLFLLKELPQHGDQMTPDSLTVLENVQLGLTEVHGLLENLLLWSKEESSDLELRKSDVDINNLALQCQQLMAVVQSVRNMKLEVQIEPGTFWRLDAHAYSTVLRNTVANSLKYAPSGTKVTCTITREHNELVTTICDQGRGIPPAILESLNMKLQSNSSNGLGLRLVKLLIEQHNGTIEFKNTRDGFCTVIRIPR